MRKILVTGMSGAGKSSALQALGQRGHDVVDTDYDGWTIDDRLWDEDRMAELLAAQRERVLFVSGTAENQGAFYDRFDAVVLLTAPADVLLDRIENRTTNGYGKAPEERARVVEHLATVEPLIRAACTHELDTSRPLDEVVSHLEEIARS
jgi:broad-specificity NMP kinase